MLASTRSAPPARRSSRPGCVARAHGAAGPGDADARFRRPRRQRPHFQRLRGARRQARDHRRELSAGSRASRVSCRAKPISRCSARPAVRAVDWGSDQAELRLDSGETLRAKLLVAADGADSWLRGQAGMQAEETSYGQTAVVANFSIERPHRGTAFQWFRTDGVLALLPLPGDRASMVWSAQQDLADRLLSLDAARPCRGGLRRLPRRARPAHCHYAAVGVSAALDPGKQTGRASPCAGGRRRA